MGINEKEACAYASKYHCRVSCDEVDIVAAKVTFTVRSVRIDPHTHRLEPYKRTAVRVGKLWSVDAAMLDMRRGEAIQYCVNRIINSRISNGSTAA